MKKNIILIYFIFICFSISAQNIQLVFRYDDFILKTDVLNEKVIRLFQKHQIPLVLGIIPCDEKEKIALQTNYAFLPELKEAVANGSIEIAQHGLTHLKLGNGEFGNVKKEEQYRRIKKGKEILDSIFKIKIVTFIPPFNAYDENTLNVLSRLGIKGISSALCIGQPSSNPSISYYPETIENFGQLSLFLEHNKNRSGIVVVMFHHYTFNNRYSLSNLDSLLTSLKTKNELEFVTFNDLYSKKIISGRKRMKVNMESNLLSKQLHVSGMIQTTSFSNSIRILNILLYMLCCVVVYLLSAMLFFRNTVNWVKICWYIIALLLVVGCAVYFHLLSPLKLLLLLCALSALAPFLLNTNNK